MRKILQVIVIFLGLGFAILGIRNLLYTDKDQIKRVIERERRDLEEEDLGGCMEGLDLEFRWQEDDLNYFVARRVLRELFGTFDDIKIKLAGLNMEIKNKEATVKFEITATAKKVISGERQGFYQEPGVIFLKKIMGQWKIVEVGNSLKLPGRKSRYRSYSKQMLTRVNR